MEVTNIALTQSSSRVLMVEPIQFGLNTQTASDNSFQDTSAKVAPDSSQQSALLEFRKFAALLTNSGVEVTITSAAPGTPDSIFPNNWFSTHREANKEPTLVLYPMRAPNRRLERINPIILKLKEQYPNIIDFSHFEKDNVFLEGTGSLILDRVNRIAYASLSNRTSHILVREWCKIMDYTPITFHAHDLQGKDIYHTNVVMSVGSDFIVICRECIPDAAEKKRITQLISSTHKHTIEITMSQLYNFCGNILEFETSAGERVIAMSERARSAFTERQLDDLRDCGRIVAAPLDCIETLGGGSARCMLAQLF